MTPGQHREGEREGCSLTDTTQRYIWMGGAGEDPERVEDEGEDESGGREKV